MFYVGQKYKGQFSGNICECVYVSAIEAVLMYSNGSFAVASVSKENSWTEYHEPVVVKEVGYITNTGKGYYKTDNTKYSGCVGSFEFTVTDGKLTDVRIL